MLEKGLTTVKPGEELYLTDVMSELGARGDLVAYDFDGIRYDMGNKLGIMKANCEVALKHPEIGDGWGCVCGNVADNIRLYPALFRSSLLLWTKPKASA